MRGVCGLSSAAVCQEMAPPVLLPEMLTIFEVVIEKKELDRVRCAEKEKKYKKLKMKIIY